MTAIRSVQYAAERTAFVVMVVGDAWSHTVFQAVLSQHASGRLTGIVMGFVFHSPHTIPICEVCAFRSDLGS